MYRDDPAPTGLLFFHMYHTRKKAESSSSHGFASHAVTHEQFVGSRNCNPSPFILSDELLRSFSTTLFAAGKALSSASSKTPWLARWLHHGRRGSCRPPLAHRSRPEYFPLPAR